MNATASLLARAFLSWVPLGVAITGLCLLSYALVQQNYRQSLNDPQIRMVEDAVAALDSGAVPASVVPRGQLINIAESLSPWIAVYDTTGEPLEASGYLDNAPPRPPKGIFDDLAAGRVTGAGIKSAPKRDELLHLEENRLTWQPNPKVRQALVVRELQDGGFVAAGRNMREVERRISQTGSFTMLAWFVSMLATFVAMVIAKYLKLQLRQRYGHV